MSKIRRFDSLHIAFAEKAKADVMLIIDDKLEKMTEQIKRLWNLWVWCALCSSMIWGVEIIQRKDRVKQM